MKRWGPWLVALGAGLWGTENIWRQPLSRIFDGVTIVFWEHVLLAAIFLPVIVAERARLATISARAWAFLVVSGAAGSAVGTVFYTKALALGDPTVVSVVVAIQPLFSTVGAVVLLGDRLAPRFFVWAFVAIACGLLLSVDDPRLILHALRTGAFRAGTGYALLCALFWGLATVAGRGVMVEVPVFLGSALRLAVGLTCIAIIRAAAAHGPLVPAGALTSTQLARMIQLVTIAGALPLVVYFVGLRFTRASTAGYFEQLQTIVAAFVGWAFLGGGMLTKLQLACAVVLVFAVVMVQIEQERFSGDPAAPAAP